ncbi:MAG TPA: biotin synthase BioB [Planctomycetota bacterium]|nr:biotin synthase BioB [Planctomycetota bacterium]
MPTINAFEEAVLAGRALDAADAAALVATSETQPFEMLHSANRIREHYKGNVVRLCSIVNARSGACSEDCRFCAQSARHNTGVATYPLVSAERILEAASASAKMGADCFGIVTSGRGPGSDRDFRAICATAARIAGVEACASLGSLTPEMAAALKAAGVARYNHNIETARSFYPTICTTHGFDDRVATVKAAKAAGMRVCCGGIFGLGENWGHRIEMALELRELDVDTVPINFLNPIPGTKLANQPVLPPLEALRIIALFRFLLPEKNIKTAGGRERCLGDFQSWMFYAGANGTLIGNYLTTKGRAAEEDRKMIREMGLRVRKEVGNGGAQAG